jgi:C4-dicarboxylate-specific signal transduction histidine kinase
MSRPTRILLIDDDQVDRMACRRAFATEPGTIEFQETDSGREGLRLARAERFDCILLDYRLPDLDGLEVLAELAKSKGVTSPVVMLTGANDIGVAVEAMRRGVQDYLLKDSEREFLQLLPRIVDRVMQEQRLAEQKLEAESALAHAHRIMTAGELAATLAHQLNQPLAAIATFSEACAQLLNRPRPDLRKLRNNIDQIATQAQRAGNSIRELRAFLAKGDAEKRPVDLNGLVQAVVELIAGEAQTWRILLVLELTDPLPPVVAASLPVEHVIVNLLQNAIDAMRSAGTSNGTITVATRNLGDRAQISVADTGPGISPDLARRIFEPLYTTKAEGLGMGLAISRNVVGAHGGSLWVESDGKAGATFHFTLPFAP